jgi:transcriptional regulator with XRE-family HTH domain
MPQETYDLAPLLRDFRKRYGLPQKRLAELLHVCPGTVKSWEYDLRYPHRPTRMWIAMELRRLGRELTPTPNARMHCGRKPGPTSIWSKLPPTCRETPE